MSFKLLTQSLNLLAAVHYASSATYSRSNRLTGQNFLNAFTWETKQDLNWGRVNYVDFATARSKGLVSVNGDTVTLRADSTTALNSTGPWRDSFYLMSNDQYTTHVAIFDIEHMPEGCGTWPAELGANWPHGGEIDIVEGVNDQCPDTITLHTGAGLFFHPAPYLARFPDLPSTIGCTMPPDRLMTGTSKGNNCDVDETNNASCGVVVNTPNSFGPEFNSVGGGWYAIERTPTFIKVYFWSRNSLGVPSEITNPGSRIDTEDWGVPAAYFPSGRDCNFATHLSAFHIVIDLDFCGAWAGAVYSQSGCPSTCTEYVNSNPSAFKNAFFTFNSLTIYQ